MTEETGKRQSLLRNRYYYPSSVENIHGHSGNYI
jgi:hypothetical protein